MSQVVLPIESCQDVKGGYLVTTTSGTKVNIPTSNLVRFQMTNPPLKPQPLKVNASIQRRAVEVAKSLVAKFGLTLRTEKGRLVLRNLPSTHVERRKVLPQIGAQMKKLSQETGLRTRQRLGHWVIQLSGQRTKRWIRMTHQERKDQLCTWLEWPVRVKQMKPEMQVVCKQ